jgi:tetratricopeptide (TPR) repeat protein|tara:strand:- start:4509 stop:6074 length:1566 start_codon:yes stop_codon:yes gene_type:complete
MIQKSLKQKTDKLINHFQAGNYNLVLRESKLLLKKLPGNPFLYNLIGSCYQNLNDLQTAKITFQHVLKLDNKNIAAFNNLGNVYKALKDFENAESNFKSALSLNPKYLNALVNYGSLKYELNYYEEAIELYNKAISFNDKIPMAHYNLGLVYQSLGQFDKSRFHLQELLKLDPRATRADKILSRFTKYEVGNSHINTMEQKLNEIELNDVEKINLLFALGKAYEDLNEYEKSFHYLKQGNITKKKLLNYNIERDIKTFQTLKQFFGNFDFSKINNKEFENKIIFIVGMPRSGTSLVEQIISSHSEVYGAGELPYLENIMSNDFFENKKLNLDKLKELNSTDKLKQIADRYKSLINNFDYKEDSITDKAPLNFRWIGLIKLILPNSKIIHCARDPKDNCFSLYKNIFDENLDWTYDQNDLFKFYQEYRELMDFWKKNFPDYIYDVKYESLISNSKEEIENLLTFCQLDWEPECLEFYKNKRAIKTVSSAQVRESFYNSSINSNKNYDKFLAELYSSLDKNFK